MLASHHRSGRNGTFPKLGTYRYTLEMSDNTISGNPGTLPHKQTGNRVGRKRRFLMQRWMP